MRAAGHPESQDLATFDERALGIVRSSFPPEARVGRVIRQSVSQGATNTLWSAITMESLIDVTAQDVIFWEYSVNAGPPGPEEAATLDLWLQRIVQRCRHSQRVPSSLPAIVLMYLWERRGVPSPSHIRMRLLGSHAPIIRRYLSQGMDISVINIAARMQENTRIITVTTDGIHPTRNVSAFLSDSLAHYLLREATIALSENPRVCRVPHARGRTIRPVTSEAALRQDVHLGALMRAHSIIGLSLATPNFMASEMQATFRLHDADKHAAENLPNTKALPAERHDSKLGYKLPLCGHGRSLTFSTGENGGLAATALILGFNDFAFVHENLRAQLVAAVLDAAEVHVNGRAVRPVNSTASNKLLGTVDPAHQYFPFWYFFPAEAGKRAGGTRPGGMARVSTVSICTTGIAAQSAIDVHDRLGWPHLSYIGVLQ